MTNSSWGTKRTCPRCSANFYDLKKSPAHCPKCQHQFEPLVLAKAKRKVSKRNTEDKGSNITPTILAKKSEAARKKDKKDVDADSAGDDIVELEDDIESLQELTELNDRDEGPNTEDDADEEAIIDDMNTGEKVLVENVEDEEARVLVEEIEEEEQAAVLKKKNKATKPK